jgi:hypothetical protein
MVHAALRINFWLVGARSVCELRARQDVEVVVCSMTTRVPFGANGSAYAVSASQSEKEAVETNQILLGTLLYL